MRLSPRGTRLRVSSNVDQITCWSPASFAAENPPIVNPSTTAEAWLLYTPRVTAEAAFRSAQARLQNARQTLERLEPLVTTHAVAQQEVDNARSELQAAQAASDAAKKDLDDTDVKAEIIAREGNYIIRLNIRPGGSAPGAVEISAQSEETGSSEISVDATIDGPGLVIAFKRDV